MAHDDVVSKFKPANGDMAVFVSIRDPKDPEGKKNDIYVIQGFSDPTDKNVADRELHTIKVGNQMIHLPQVNQLIQKFSGGEQTLVTPLGDAYIRMEKIDPALMPSGATAIPVTFTANHVGHNTVILTGLDPQKLARDGLALPITGWQEILKNPPNQNVNVNSQPSATQNGQQVLAVNPKLEELKRRAEELKKSTASHVEKHASLAALFKETQDYYLDTMNPALANTQKPAMAEALKEPFSKLNDFIKNQPSALDSEAKVSEYNKHFENQATRLSSVLGTFQKLTLEQARSQSPAPKLQQQVGAYYTPGTLAESQAINQGYRTERTEPLAGWEQQWDSVMSRNNQLHAERHARYDAAKRNTVYVNGASGRTREEAEMNRKSWLEGKTDSYGIASNSGNYQHDAHPDRESHLKSQSASTGHSSEDTRLYNERIAKADKAMKDHMKQNASEWNEFVKDPSRIGRYGIPAGTINIDVEKNGNLRVRHESWSSRKDSVNHKECIVITPEMMQKDSALASQVQNFMGNKARAELEYTRNETLKQYERGYQRQLAELAAKENYVAKSRMSPQAKQTRMSGLAAEHQSLDQRYQEKIAQVNEAFGEATASLPAVKKDSSIGLPSHVREEIMKIKANVAAVGINPQHGTTFTGNGDRIPQNTGPIKQL